MTEPADIMDFLLNYDPRQMRKRAREFARACGGTRAAVRVLDDMEHAIVEMRAYLADRARSQTCAARGIRGYGTRRRRRYARPEPGAYDAAAARAREAQAAACAWRQR